VRGVRGWSGFLLTVLVGGNLFLGSTRIAEGTVSQMGSLVSDALDIASGARLNVTAKSCAAGSLVTHSGILAMEVLDDLGDDRSSGGRPTASPVSRRQPGGSGTIASPLQGYGSALNLPGVDPFPQLECEDAPPLAILKNPQSPRGRPGRGRGGGRRGGFPGRRSGWGGGGSAR
jgi:hypothetical protein